MTRDEARRMVEQIQFAAQKCRSNAFDTCGFFDSSDPIEVEIFNSLFPYLDPEHALNLVEVTTRMLAGGRDITPGDLFNLLYLAHRTPMIGLWWMIVHEEELPTSKDAMLDLAQTTGLC